MTHQMHSVSSYTSTYLPFSNYLTLNFQNNY